MFLLAVPYVALPIYLFLGHSRFPGYISARRSSGMLLEALREYGEAHKATYVESSSVPSGNLHAFVQLATMPIVSGNDARILIDGEATFRAMFEEIERARSYILVSFYIIRDDRIGRDFKEKLIAKARAGCTVRLLYDALGSYNLPERYLSDLREAGVVVRNFHSIRQPHSRLQVNFRNHRKVVVVDGEAAFLGGINLGDEYLGRDPKYGRWRDTHLCLRGPVVVQVQLVFAEDWLWASDERLDLHWEPERVEERNLDALIVAPSPADPMETGSLLFCTALNAAQRRIWISTPYFVPDIDVLSALKVAALRGVDVRILIADKQDHFLVWLAAFAYLDEIREAGVKIFRYMDGFLHQKAFLIDDDVATIGTMNLDNRSCRLNFEITALIFDRGFNAEVAAMFEQDLSRSFLYETPLDRAPSRLLRYGAPFARLFGPIL